MPRRIHPRPLQSADEAERRFRKARTAFSVAYMSDTKWRTLFAAIAAAGLILDRAEWKFIDTDQIHSWGVPDLTDLLPDRFADGRFPPVEYKWIEWIRFPRSCRGSLGAGRIIEQDLDGLLQVLTSIGQLQVERGPDDLTVFGYGR